MLARSQHIQWITNEVVWANKGLIWQVGGQQDKSPTMTVGFASVRIHGHDTKLFWPLPRDK